MPHIYRWRIVAVFFSFFLSNETCHMLWLSILFPLKRNIQIHQFILRCHTMCKKAKSIHSTYKLWSTQVKLRVRLSINLQRPRGVMANASDFGSEDWWFESFRGRYFFLSILVKEFFYLYFIPFQYLTKKI